MPLLAGTDRATIAHNIREMERAGHPHDQAVAAALHTAYGDRRPHKARHSDRESGVDPHGSEVRSVASAADGPQQRVRRAWLSPPALEDPRQFLHRPDVPILLEHPETGLTLERLQLLADNGNRRAAYGNFPQILIGHTKDDQPEEQQPRCVGYARNFGIGDFEGKPALLVDFFIKRSEAERCGEYPHRSAEVWRGPRPEHWVIDHISLLKTSPRFDLGMITRYSRRGDRNRQRLRYAYAGPCRDGVCTRMPPHRHRLGHRDLARFCRGLETLGLDLDQFARRSTRPAAGQMSFLDLASSPPPPPRPNCGTG
ncbi:MAG: hypothetical protein IRY99_23535, partial [Isosphaeraceae bacterium]|nr:hypothetical protein [Isosphaeraceae bacterium]